VVNELTELKRLQHEKEQALAQLYASQQRYADLVSAVPGIVWEADPHTNQFTFVSDQAEELTGYTKSQWLSPGFIEECASDIAFDQLPPSSKKKECATKQEESTALHKIFTCGTSVGFKLRTALSSDERHEIWLRNISRRCEGKFTCGIMVDVTDHKLLEEVKRSRELALMQSRVKSEFIASVSHEIRTPLNGITGLSELLLDSLRDVDQREYAKSIVACSSSLLHIVNDVIDLDKVNLQNLFS